jgi:class 3 adenylate cyclase
LLQHANSSDGVEVEFGYPHAHEDDAEQAVRAGLALIDAVGTLEGPQHLQVRIGIATGAQAAADRVRIFLDTARARIS